MVSYILVGGDVLYKALKILKMEEYLMKTS